MNQMNLVQSPTFGGTQLDFPSWGEWITRIMKTMVTCNKRHQTRRQFAVVETRILRDVGISEADRFIEVNKSFWEE